MTISMKPDMLTIIMAVIMVLLIVWFIKMLMSG